MVSSKRIFVYVAGPITSDPIPHTRKALLWWHKLWETGLIVPYVPHVDMLQQLVKPLSYESCMEHDLEILHRMDALFRLEGKSPGADREIKHMISLGKRTFLESEYGQLLQWTKEQFDAKKSD